MPCQPQGIAKDKSLAAAGLLALVAAQVASAMRRTPTGRKFQRSISLLLFRNGLAGLLLLGRWMRPMVMPLRQGLARLRLHRGLIHRSGSLHVC